METISHREMRNRSGEILRRVEAGETIRVTNNGRVSAVIGPPTGSAIEALISRGEARAAISEREALLALAPTRISISAAELIDDARGEW